mmetsp:Transcript_690/g.2128  ORF Transcript_690/g.2128 Transcript_690/m.2128 type:complete len:355 (-) Transcript_690:406-1470(-)
MARRVVEPRPCAVGDRRVRVLPYLAHLELVVDGAKVAMQQHRVGRVEDGVHSSLREAAQHCPAAVLAADVAGGLLETEDPHPHEHISCPQSCDCREQLLTHPTSALDRQAAARHNLSRSRDERAYDWPEHRALSLLLGLFRGRLGALPDQHRGRNRTRAAIGASGRVGRRHGRSHHVVFVLERLEPRPRLLLLRDRSHETCIDARMSLRLAARLPHHMVDPLLSAPAELAESRHHVPLQRLTTAQVEDHTGRPTHRQPVFVAPDAVGAGKEDPPRAICGAKVETADLWKGCDKQQVRPKRYDVAVRAPTSPLCLSDQRVRLELLLEAHGHAERGPARLVAAKAKVTVHRGQRLC